MGVDGGAEAVNVDVVVDEGAGAGVLGLLGLLRLLRLLGLGAEAVGAGMVGGGDAGAGVLDALLEGCDPLSVFSGGVVIVVTEAGDLGCFSSAGLGGCSRGVVDGAGCWFCCC